MPVQDYHFQSLARVGAVQMGESEEEVEEEEAAAYLAEWPELPGSKKLNKV